MRSWTTSAAETEEEGARVARARPRNADLFAAIYLSGDLGAGKTTWARGFFAACGVTAVVIACRMSRNSRRSACAIGRNLDICGSSSGRSARPVDYRRRICA